MLAFGAGIAPGTVPARYGFPWRQQMPQPNLSSMSVDALLKLRDDINEVLDRKANELRSTRPKLD